MGGFIILILSLFLLLKGFAIMIVAVIPLFYLIVRTGEKIIGGKERTSEELEWFIKLRYSPNVVNYYRAKRDVNKENKYMTRFSQEDVAKLVEYGFYHSPKKEYGVYNKEISDKECILYLKEMENK